MNWTEIQNQLNDLPATYKRTGDTYQFLVNAITAGLFSYANAADGVMSQLVFAQAVGKWLDVWGRLFNIPRNDGESDPAYLNRISYLLVAGRGTPVAIDQYLALVDLVEALVVEQFPAAGFTISFTSVLPDSGYLRIAQDLVNARPAGVPFLPFSIVKGGLYLGTVNYLGASKVTGAYLNSGGQDFIPDIGDTTNNAVPLLPTLFLTDHTLNPSLAG